MPTRRTFLSTAAGGMLMGAAADALHAADQREPVSVAVIGCGGRGCDLIRALTTIEGVRLVGVCDDYAPHLAQGAKYAGPQAQPFADYRPLLDKLRPQAVVVAAPLTWHYRLASDAVSAGCDVFCEKTMCYTIDEARRLARQVADSRRVFQVGLQRRANAIYQQAAAMVEAGLLGQITAIKAQWHRHNHWRRPVPVAKSDATWAELEKRLNWRLYRDASGGLMTELGSHQMDVANWLLGTTPRRVLASGGVDYWRDGRDVYDNIFCVYEYELAPATLPVAKSGNGLASPQVAAAASPKPYTVRVTYSSLCNNAYEGAAELVMGTKGTLYLTSDKGLLFREAAAERIDWATAGNQGERAAANASLVSAGKTLKLASDPWAHRGKPVEIDNDGGDDTRAELVSFIDHVRRSDPQTLIDAAAGLKNAATVLIANEAAEAWRAVDFPADLG